MKKLMSMALALTLAFSMVPGGALDALFGGSVTSALLDSNTSAGAYAYADESGNAGAGGASLSDSSTDSTDTQKDINWISESSFAPEYDYEIYSLRTDGVGIYTGVYVPFYIKSDNPDGEAIRIIDSEENNLIVMNNWVSDPSVGYYDDIQYLSSDDAFNYLRKVEGGWTGRLYFETAGEQELRVVEGHEDGYSVVCTLKVNVLDYDTEEQKWMQNVIDACTTSDMTSFDKMHAVCNYLLGTLDFKYLINDGNRNLLYLAVQSNNPYFETHRWDSYISPAKLCDFAELIGGFDDIHDCYGDYPRGSDEWSYTHYLCRVTIGDDVRYYEACPFSETGAVEYSMIDFSNTQAMDTFVTGAGWVPGNDKAALTQALETAQAERARVVISDRSITVDSGSVYVSEREANALDEVIASAQIIVANSRSTQRGIDAALVELNAALETFKAAEKAGSKSGNRLWDNDADQTSVEISKAGFSTSNWAILARMDDFADAMSATGLAGLLDAPILLTDRYGLSECTAQELQRLGVQNVYIIGGTGAMPGNFEQQLNDIGIANVDRIYGNEFYDTSVQCAYKIAQYGSTQDLARVIVAYGQNFQDALSISSYAYKYHVPILLQTPGETSAVRALSDEAYNLIDTGDFADALIFVTGGNGAVSYDSVEGHVSWYNHWVIRLGGETGYDTSNIIANYFIGGGALYADTVCIATGAEAANGVDALAGAALAGKNSGVVLLASAQPQMEAENYATISGGDADGNASFLEAYAADINTCYVLGGSYVLPDAFQDKIGSIFS